MLPRWSWMQSKFTGRFGKGNATRRSLFFFFKNFQYFCNCDAAGEFDVDEGILSNKSQLPVVQLNYGDSLNRFSWIIYKLENLKCYGKANGVIYPSEQNEDRIKNIEDDVEENSKEIEIVKERTGENENEIVQIQQRVGNNENEISSLKSRTSNLEGKVYHRACLDFTFSLQNG